MLGGVSWEAPGLEVGSQVGLRCKNGEDESSTRLNVRGLARQA